jgi:glutaredoxin 3
MVKIFVTPVCPYCYTLKEFLKENNIEFEEIDVSQNEKLKDELIKKTGKIEVPVLDINGQIVVGFDKEKICKLLKIQ